MFERNKVDNRTSMTVAVQIVFVDGSMVTGRAPLSPTKGVHQLLDSADSFLFLELFNGEAAFVPKSEIKALSLITPIRTQTLKIVPQDATDFDPHRVLGVSPQAEWDEVRQAYHRLTKLYHPDKYASVELPAEVRTYLDGMAKLVNASFRALRNVTKAKVA
jgi:hypothetical protein